MQLRRVKDINTNQSKNKKTLESELKSLYVYCSYFFHDRKLTY